jgi:S-adenosylmethionine synthetase
VVIGGEVGLSDQEQLKNYMGRIGQIARDCIKDIGYEQDKFHWNTCHVLNFLHEQSAHIAQGVNAADNKDEGAGDQGIMFGYAVDETPELMPAPIQYAHAILRRLAEVRKSGAEPTLGPDAKSQLTVRYEGGKPVDVTSIVLSTQHLDEDMTSDDVRAVVEPYIREVLPEGWITEDTKWWVNPTGKFVIGGPDGDAGLTGRKIIVDTYGGAAPHGGGAFSGKDPTKVDRSAAYAARYLAKNVVAAGLAKRCTIQLSYAIGVASRCRSMPTPTAPARSRAGHREGRRRDHGPDPARHPHASAAQPPDLSAHGGLWPFRPRAGGRWRVFLGTDGPRRGAQGRRLTGSVVSWPSPRTARIATSMAVARASTCATARRSTWSRTSRACLRARVVGREPRAGPLDLDAPFRRARGLARDRVRRRGAHGAPGRAQSRQGADRM